MNISCSKEKLNEAAVKVFSAVSKKTTIPAQEGILLTAENNTLTLCGYDLEIGITTVIDVSLKEAGSVVIPAKIFVDIVRSLNSEQINIYSDAKNKCLISGGISEFTVSGLSANEFPELPKFKAENSFKIGANELTDLIKKTMFAIAVVDYRPVYTGSKFIIEKNKATVVSIDNFRLAKAETAVSSENEFSFILPGKAIHEVLKIFNDKEADVLISLEKSHIMFESEGVVLTSRLLAGEFINFSSVIPQKNCSFININTRELIEATELVSLIINDKQLSPLRLDFADGLLKISCFTSTGKSYHETACEMTGEDILIGINYKYLLDALKAADTETIKISMTNSNTALLITPPEGEDFLYIISPMKILSNEAD